MRLPAVFAHKARRGAEVVPGPCPTVIQRATVEGETQHEESAGQEDAFQPEFISIEAGDEDHGYGVPLEKGERA